MGDLKNDIEQWIEEWHPERCKPGVEVVLSTERIALYEPKTPVLTILQIPSIYIKDFTLLSELLVGNIWQYLNERRFWEYLKA